MKRLLFMLSLLIMVLAPVSCFYMDEADTVDPGDESFTNPTPPVGGITTLTATVGNLSAVNPRFSISFNTPVNHSSIDYDEITGSIRIEYPIGTNLEEGTDFIAIPSTPSEDASVIYIDLSASTPVQFDTVRIVLTTGLNAGSNNTISLSNPGNFDRLVD